MAHKSRDSNTFIRGVRKLRPKPKPRIQMRSSITRATSVLTTLLLAFAGLVFTTTPAQAAIVLNANGVSLNFNEGTQTVTNYAGNGKTAGSVVKYAGVATISSTVVDAVIETTTVTGATISSFDGGSAISGNNQFLQSDISTSGAGSVVYKFSFYLGGSYTGVGTGTPVILQNVYVNSYDLDASLPGVSNQYTQFTGVQSYTLSTNTTLGVSSSGNLLQFISTAGNVNYSSSSGSYTKGRVQVKYDNLSTISIKFGTDAAGSGGTSYFAFDFSVGLAWTEGSTTITTSSVTNSYNSPPTSTNDAQTVAASNSVFLTTADFGTYADVDLNPWVSVSIESLPTTGTLQWFNGTVWANVTVGQVISTIDLDANKLRYTAAGTAGTPTFTYKVSDGLASSTAAYTLTITVTGGGQIQSVQMITYAQPSNQLLSNGSVTVAPTASSGLAVSLASTTPSVCTVSGFVITLVSVGTCTTTASQPGNASYSAAMDVTRSFQITLIPQVITFVQPANQLLSAGTLTVAPTADSGLTVTLASTTPSECTVSGFVITLVATGTCSITASRLGNATYSAATDVVRIFQITLLVETLPAAPDIDPVSGKTDGTTPITLPVPVNRGSTGSSCLIDPVDLICKQTVTIAGKGTFTLSPDGKTTFQAAPGFFGTLTVQYRVTDGYGRFDIAPVTVEVLNPNPGTEPNNENPASSQSGTTKGTTPVVLTPEKAPPAGAEICLVDPTDNVCKTVVKLPGVGTWTQSPNGSVKFVPVEGYIGSNTVIQRVTRASFKGSTPFTVTVSKTRGPVTTTISGFADGSPALTKAIRAKIDAFLRAHADYKNVFCIGYTEGPTVLKTDAALSKARAVNGCAYVKAGLGKKLTLKQLTSSQGTVEAAKFRRITITLTD